jgi:hypothetical protein
MSDTKRDDGGPAFPVESSLWQGHGMTLRDYFATHAPLPPTDFGAKTWSEQRAVPAHDGRLGDVRLKTIVTTESAADYVARWSYVYADAMLKARST